uniref:Uncharacterized protein n=1 Tax=Kalanchoe fedtschenkoi TaxID=63787 RepID=A0A7N0RFP1_KALFE
MSRGRRRVLRQRMAEIAVNENAAPLLCTYHRRLMADFIDALDSVVKQARENQTKSESLNDNFCKVGELCRVQADLI